MKNRNSLHALTAVILSVIALIIAISAFSVYSSGKGSTVGTKDRLKAGNWQVFRSVDPMTDKVTNSAKLTSSDGIGSYYNQDASINITCRNDNIISVYIDWVVFVGNERDKVDVSLRFDSGNVNTSEWIESRDRTATFSPDPKSVLVEMVKSNKVSARVTTYEGYDITVFFDVQGARNAFKEITDNCREEGA